MTVETHYVHAFVDNGQGGNLAGVVIDAHQLAPEQMQSIATQVGASESAFVFASDRATYRVRFFTPTVEVNLCGHATIATWTLLLQKGLCQAGTYSEETLAGIIGISIRPDGLIFMEQPDQEFMHTVDAVDIANTLGLPVEQLDPSLPLQVVNDGLMVAVRSETQLDSLRPNMTTLTRFSNQHGFSAYHVFTLQPNTDALAAVRSFDPAVGIPEDAATGTGNGSFLTYLQQYDRLPEQDIYRIEQGKAMGNPSCIYGKFIKGRVWIGGYGSIKKTVNLPV